MKLTELLFCSALATAPLALASADTTADKAVSAPPAPRIELQTPSMEEFSANFDLDEISMDIVQDLKSKLVSSNPLGYSYTPSLKQHQSFAQLKDKVKPGVSESTSKQLSSVSATADKPQGKMEFIPLAVVANR